MDRSSLNQITVNQAAEILAVRRAASASIGGLIKVSFDMKDLQGYGNQIGNYAKNMWNSVPTPNLEAATASGDMGQYWTDTAKESLRNALAGGAIGGGIGGLKSLISGDGDFFGGLASGGLTGAALGGAGTGLYRGGRALMSPSATKVQEEAAAKATEEERKVHKQNVIDASNQANATPGHHARAAFLAATGVDPVEMSENLNLFGGDESDTARHLKRINRPGILHRGVENLAEYTFGDKRHQQDLFQGPPSTWDNPLGALNQDNFGTLDQAAIGGTIGYTGPKVFNRAMLGHDLHNTYGDVTKQRELARLARNAALALEEKADPRMVQARNKQARSAWRWLNARNNLPSFEAAAKGKGKNSQEVKDLKKAQKRLKTTQKSFDAAKKATNSLLAEIKKNQPVAEVTSPEIRITPGTAPGYWNQPGQKGFFNGLRNQFDKLRHSRYSNGQASQQFRQHVQAAQGRRTKMPRYLGVLGALLGAWTGSQPPEGAGQGPFVPPAGRRMSPGQIPRRWVAPVVPTNTSRREARFRGANPPKSVGGSPPPNFDRGGRPQPRWRPIVGRPFRSMAPWVEELFTQGLMDDTGHDGSGGARVGETFQ